MGWTVQPQNTKQNKTIKYDLKSPVFSILAEKTAFQNPTPWTLSLGHVCQSLGCFMPWCCFSTYFYIAEVMPCHVLGASRKGRVHPVLPRPLPTHSNSHIPMAASHDYKLAAFQKDVKGWKAPKFSVHAISSTSLPRFPTFSFHSLIQQICLTSVKS